MLTSTLQICGKAGAGAPWCDIHLISVVYAPAYLASAERVKTLGIYLSKSWAACAGLGCSGVLSRMAVSALQVRRLLPSFAIQQ